MKQSPPERPADERDSHGTVDRTCSVRNASPERSSSRLPRSLTRRISHQNLNGSASVTRPRTKHALLVNEMRSLREAYSSTDRRLNDLEGLLRDLIQGIGAGSLNGEGQAKSSEVNGSGPSPKADGVAPAAPSTSKLSFEA